MGAFARWGRARLWLCRREEGRERSLRLADLLFRVGAGIGLGLASVDWFPRDFVLRSDVDAGGVCGTYYNAHDDYALDKPNDR